MIIEVGTGHSPIPFGTYNIVPRLEGGFITVIDGDYWRIISIL